MRAVGNAALLGAATLAFSPESLTEALDFAKKVEHVDLASEEGFRRNLIASLRLAP
jgi:uncharacterized 2Fe-2S/4Fe-4S cluster protein (DUF4445 family)